MSEVYFISDLHLGHKKILEFSPDRGGTDVVSHSEWLVQQWNSVVTKRDLVWVLGDVCFDQDHMKYLKQMNGVKHLILGNHDQFGIDYYKHFFNKIHGFLKYKGFWLSHAPIHPGELRGLPNIHGHTHGKEMEHIAYFNVCVEQWNGKPVSYDFIKSFY